MNLASFLAPSPFDLVGHIVTATVAIKDSPLAEVDCSAKRGDSGEVVDYDASAGLYYVDFGHGAIACEPKEIS